MFLAREVVWREISGPRILRGHVAGGRDPIVSEILTSFLSTIDSIKNYSDNSLYPPLFPFRFQTNNKNMARKDTNNKRKATTAEKEAEEQQKRYVLDQLH